MSELRRRTRSFAIEVVRFCSTLPPTEEARVIRRQLLRSGTSPGAHCREATRARSDAEMVSKIETALQELDESVYWMELLIEADIVPQERLQAIMEEADELIAMAVAAART
ncbi:MAG TPA: four helix bundle protein, partial [Thermoanaerobaculia bacterium]|nr:four helix bundle protein [Thermoanaerobaculia bacterium]